MINQYYLFTTILDDYLRIDKNTDNQGNYELFLLFLSFQGYRDWIFIDKFQDQVFITQHFFGDDEGEDVVLNLSNNNYDYIIQQWNKVLAQKPKYLILTRDDNGWIDLEMKNELLLQDQQYLDQDKIKKLSNSILEN